MCYCVEMFTALMINCVNHGHLIGFFKNYLCEQIAFDVLEHPILFFNI